MTLLSGLHVASSNAGVAMQETVRAHLATLYPLLIDRAIEIRGGQIPLVQSPGIGARWRDDLFDSSHPGYRISKD